MATNPTPPPGNTGGSSLGGNLQQAAGNLVGPALDLAQGATAFQAASNALKGAALDKLLGPTALFAGGLIGVLRTVKSIVEQSGILERGFKNIANIQQIEGKFETLLKSADKAHERLKALYSFTASAPFDFSDVAEANRILESLTRGALSSAEGMKVVGDVAAATGQSMTEVAERVGKLYAALRSGRGLDKIMFQLQASGAVSDELAGKLETLQQAGAGFNEMWGAVAVSLARADGGMKNEMASLDGLAKRLKTAGQMMETAFASSFVEAQAKAIETSIKATQNITPVLAKIGSDLAPVLQFFSSAKNSIEETTIATKGFATMLGVAWEAGKALFVGLAGTALASFAARLLTSGSAIVEWGVQLKAAASVAKAAPASLAGFANATSLASDASAAFGRAEYLTAAGLKLKSYWAFVATTATNIHAASMMRAATATNGVSIATYLWATATQVAAGGVKLLGLALATAGKAMAGFIIANPVLAIGTAALAAGYAMKQWANSIAEADNAYVKMIGTMSKVRAEMRAQIIAVRNLDQWKKALADNDVAIKANGDEQKKLGERPGDKFAMGADYKVRKVANPEQETYDALYEEHNLTTRKLVEERAKLMTRDMNTVGLGGDEQAKLGEQTAGNMRIADARRQAGAAGADDGGRLAFLNSEIERLTKEADLGEQIDKKRVSPLRNPGRSELNDVQDQIDAVENGTQKVDPTDPTKLYRRRAELGNFADTWQDKRGTVAGMQAEKKAQTDALYLKKLELDLDRSIAQVRVRGGQTAGLEARKELIILREQLRIARAKGENGRVEAEEVARRINEVEGRNAGARGDIAVNRAKDNAQINGDPRAAQAMQDNADLAKLRADYDAKGLTSQQADSDFAAGIKSQAAQAQPRIVADSMQSIGGGGGSYGSDPLLAAQQRLLAIGETQNAYLKIISDAATNKTDGTLR